MAAQFDRPIFRSTGQAISFAFLVQAFDASPESQLAKELRKHQAMLGESGRRSTVDFGGLNPLEIRGQAAIIRSAMDTKLPKPEADALRARYGLVMAYKRPDGVKEFDISEERRDAIFALAEYLHPQFDNVPRLALVLLVMKCVANISAMDYPFKTIEQLHGGAHSTMHRIFPKLRERVNALEGAALDRLTPLFERDGVVAKDYEYA